MIPRHAESLRHEYTELSLTFRHYSALRFAVLTVYFGITGGLATVAFGVAQVSNPSLQVFAKVAGAVVGLAFFLLEVLIERYLRFFVARASELESELGYKLFSGRPAQPWPLQTRVATWGLFILIIGSWVYALVRL